MSDNKLIDPNYLAEIEKPHEVRLIDANALSAYLKETNWGAELLNIIDNAPTVEAYTKEQVKELIKLNEEKVKELIELNKGEWINTSPYDDKGECSLCCYLSKKYYNFCPNCGSDMRGRRSDDE